MDNKAMIEDTVEYIARQCMECAMDEWMDEYRSQLAARAEKVDPAIGVRLMVRYAQPTFGELKDEYQAIIDSEECMDWMADYWRYVKFMEHGNEPTLAEVSGSLVDSIADPVDTLQYLAEDDSDEARELAHRLMALNAKYWRCE